jgi:hypothetical protein
MSDPLIAVLFGFLGALSALLAGNAFAKHEGWPKHGDDVLTGNFLVMLAWAGAVAVVGVIALLN